MPDSDIVLHFVYDSSDIRNFRVYQVIATAPGLLEIYRFHHPAADNTPTTSFERKNLSVLVWQPAGRIEWATKGMPVWFGVDQVPIKELRKVKHGTSQSRRFKVNGIEYKWKINENGKDLFCIDSQDRSVATWSAQEKTLRIAQNYSLITERILVSCFLNLWFKQQGRW